MWDLKRTEEAEYIKRISTAEVCACILCYCTVGGRMGGFHSLGFNVIYCPLSKAFSVTAEMISTVNVCGCILPPFDLFLLQQPNVSAYYCVFICRRSRNPLWHIFLYLTHMDLFLSGSIRCPMHVLLMPSHQNICMRSLFGAWIFNLMLIHMWTLFRW